MESKDKIGNKYIKKCILCNETAEGIIYLVKKKSNDDNKYVAKVEKIDDNMQADIENEIKILKKLRKEKCPYILKYIDDGEETIITTFEEKKLKYLITEYASNYDLGDYLLYTREGFGERCAKVIFYKIFKGIKVIHDSYICHRDIKPDNILLDENFEPKINDFNHAKIYFKENKEKKIKGNCGTINYQAPEILKYKGKKEYYGRQVDIFSLGVSLIELTLGLYCFQEAGDIKEAKYPRNRAARKYYECFRYGSKTEYWWKLIGAGSEYLSEEFKNLCMKMIAYDPKNRPTIDEILKDKWFEEINNMTSDQLKKYEKKIKLKEQIMKKKYLVTDGKKPNYIDQNLIYGLNYDVKSVKSGSQFTDEIKPEEIENIRFMNFIIYIKGYIVPKDFMNLILIKIRKEFNNDCAINICDEDAKIIIDFEDIEKNGYTIAIQLYKTNEEYLLRFIKTGGTRKDLFNIYKKICYLVENIYKF